VRQYARRSPCAARGVSGGMGVSVFTGYQGQQNFLFGDSVFI
jgi:hypothetical protein